MPIDSFTQKFSIRSFSQLQMSHVIVSYKYLTDVLHESDGGRLGSTDGPLWGVVERSTDHHDKCPNAAFINQVHMLQLNLEKMSWMQCHN